jgi:hypothetical protein
MKKIILKNEKICPESQISIGRFCFGSGGTGKTTRKMIFSQHLTTAVIGTRWWAGVDSVREQKKTRSQKNACKSRRVPPVGWSGKGGALLSLPPLRTVRATFTAYRSSISKALLDGETRQHMPALTSRYQPGATKRFRLWAHQQVKTCHHLLSHIKVVSPVFS